MIDGVVDEIIEKTCAVWDVKKEDVLGSRLRCRPYPDVRAHIAYQLWKTQTLSKSDIGRILNRSHSTIIYYLKLYEDQCGYNKDFLAKIELLDEGMKSDSTWVRVKRFLKELRSGVCGDE